MFRHKLKKFAGPTIPYSLWPEPDPDPELPILGDHTWI